MDENDVEIKVKENQTAGAHLQVLCIDCMRETRHLVRSSLDRIEKTFSPDGRSFVFWDDHYQIVECQGCARISFRHLSYFSDDEDAVERLYPPRTTSDRVVKHFQNVPTVLRRIYFESIECFNAESMTLCAAGLRALVEGICSDQEILDGPVEVVAGNGARKTIRKDDLQARIAGLHEKGLLTKGAADTLHEHRYLGNTAIHKLTRPSQQELALAIDILEHTLESLYEIPEKAATLKARRTK